MLSVLLLILKIIGIVIASVLGLILLILLLILFVPIRYKVVFDKKEASESAFSLKVSFSYLLHILNGRFVYPGDGFRLRVFIFKIMPKKEKPEKPIKEKKVKTKENIVAEVEGKYEITDTNTEPDANAKDDINTASDKAVQLSDENKDEVETPPIKENGGSDASGKQEDDEENDEKPSLKGFADKLLSVLKNIKLTLTKTYDKIIDIRDNISYYVSILESDSFKKAFKLAKKELIHILKAIGPRKIRAEIFFGSDDPSTTGQVLSYYSLIYPYIGRSVWLYPDFENKKLYGEGYLKGHITLFVLLISALKLYFSKNIKRVIKQFKKEK